MNESRRVMFSPAVHKPPEGEKGWHWELLPEREGNFLAFGIAEGESVAIIEDVEGKVYSVSFERMRFIS